MKIQKSKFLFGTRDETNYNTNRIQIYARGWFLRDGVQDLVLISFIVRLQLAKIWLKRSDFSLFFLRSCSFEFERVKSNNRESMKPTALNAVCYVNTSF